MQAVRPEKPPLEKLQMFRGVEWFVMGGGCGREMCGNLDHHGTYMPKIVVYNVLISANSYSLSIPSTNQYHNCLKMGGGLQVNIDSCHKIMGELQPPEPPFPSIQNFVWPWLYKHESVSAGHSAYWSQTVVI